MEWQPIETAPRDGRPILIWRPNENAKPNEGYCDDWRYAIGYWRAHPEWFRKGSWGDRNGASVVPTHWMPLPAPPEECARSAENGAPGARDSLDGMEK